MRLELYDSMKVLVLITTFEGNNKFEPLKPSVSILKEKEATRRQISMLFIEEVKQLNEKTESISQSKENETATLVQASRKFY